MRLFEFAERRLLVAVVVATGIGLAALVLAVSVEALFPRVAFAVGSLSSFVFAALMGYALSRYRRDRNV